MFVAVTMITAKYAVRFVSYEEGRSFTPVLKLNESLKCDFIYVLLKLLFSLEIILLIF